MGIEDILLEVFGNEKPTGWQKLTAYRTAQMIKDDLSGPNARTKVNATLRVSYFDMDGKKSELATRRILG